MQTATHPDRDRTATERPSPGAPFEKRGPTAPSGKSTVPVDEETLERLDRLREEGQSYDDLVAELVDIYESVERTMAHGGDAF